MQYTPRLYRPMYFLVVDGRACQIFNRNKHGQNGLPWWSTVGLPIADKAEYFRSSRKL
jgi:hypothetical protein